MDELRVLVSGHGFASFPELTSESSVGAQAGVDDCRPFSNPTPSTFKDSKQRKPPAKQVAGARLASEWKPCKTLQRISLNQKQVDTVSTPISTLPKPPRNFFEAGLDTKKPPLSRLEMTRRVSSKHRREMQAQVPRPQKRPQAAFSLLAKTMLKH